MAKKRYKVVKVTGPYYVDFAAAIVDTKEPEGFSSLNIAILKKYRLCEVYGMYDAQLICKALNFYNDEKNKDNKS